MPQFENPVAKIDGALVAIGSDVTTSEGVQYELARIGRTGRQAGAVMIRDRVSKHTRWIHTDFIPGLTVEESGL